MNKYKFLPILLVSFLLIIGCSKRRDNILVLDLEYEDGVRSTIRSNSPAGVVDLGLTYIAGKDSRYDVIILVGSDEVGEYELNPEIDPKDIADLVADLAKGGKDPIATLSAVVKTIFGALVLITDTNGTTDKTDDKVYLSVVGQVNLDEIASNYVSGELSIKAAGLPTLTDTVSVVGAFSEIKLVELAK